MKIESIKELDALIKLCRKRGIESVKVDNIELRLSDVAPVETQPKRSPRQLDTTGISPGGITDDTKILTEELSYEQMLFYSSEGRNETPDFDGMS